MVQLGLVVAQYDKHGAVIEAMRQSASAAAADHDADIVETVTVPGAYDTPLAADRLARREDVDAVAVLGVIIEGDTDHDQVIADAAAQGLTDVSLERDTPVTLGIIGPGMSKDEAEARTQKGGSAVTSAIELANL
ncbi:MULTISPECIES: 6,7-dimethyl-8-ribityllumazine synthase [Haloarcula]|uniref:6,7-dimethyl-8-ribityllumazine synthase n=1 Tax=Haloarcula pellucida TaxID=1427151 RepID=A0A830GMB7_9EURY|nr:MULTISPECIES: 6,7-dimethyl-8-ribityllumazine synthase [Halomicroarcula]MBX0348082.1 6,7-dimethyl-8-ribityllumazine synthase [Halomicroarcula pellucida]MDS0277927.1 6,7-dimethyl-8-ribityllumazine synthase [Halomicroarcula sp. S1AR25-4]GGN96842.1 6,7-dimethyl-8-ribityllumazine synthase [Halomicroarcula pellucida]